MAGRPASKKIARTREQAKKEAEGTRVALTASGVPVKPKKPSYICSVCKVELTPTNVTQLNAHVEGKHPKSTLAIAFPTYGV